MGRKRPNRLVRAAIIFVFTVLYCLFLIEAVYGQGRPQIVAPTAARTVGSPAYPIRSGVTHTSAARCYTGQTQPRVVIDYTRLYSEILNRMAADARFRGLRGERGPTGRPGPPGESQSIDLDELTDRVADRLTVRANAVELQTLVDQVTQRLTGRDLPPLTIRFVYADGSVVEAQRHLGGTFEFEEQTETVPITPDP